MLKEDYFHGIEIAIDNRDRRPRAIIASSIIGTVATANDADPNLFPLNRCVAVYDHNLDEMLAGAGAEGTLKETLETIFSIVRTPVVIVRVEESDDDEEETLKNIIGEENDEGKTGLYALKLAEMQAGIKPLIFGIHQYDENNDVRAALFDIAQFNYGFAYTLFEESATITDAINARNEYEIDEGLAIYNTLTVEDKKEHIDLTIPTIPAILAHRARVDQQVGWHKNISSTYFNADGVTKEITYADINPKGTEANMLNREHISVFVRDSEGIKLWGGRTLCGENSLLFYEHYTRTAQMIALTMARIMREVRQDEPYSRPILEDFELKANREFSRMTRAGYILGGRINLEKLTADDILEGRIADLAEFTPVPMLEQQKLTVRLTTDYIFNAIGGEQQS